MSYSHYGKDASTFNGNKINCGFIAPESLVTSFDEVLEAEKAFLIHCGYLLS